MTDVKLNAAGDIDLSTGGAELVEGLDARIQAMKIAMQSFQGDWFLDLRDGLPYIGRILVKNVNEADIQSLYYRQAQIQPGVVSVDRVALTQLPTAQNRVLKVELAVTFEESVESQNITIEQTGLT